MKHDYTDEEIKTAWKDSLSLLAFLDALPERPQAAEIAKLKAEREELDTKLTEVVKAAERAGWNGVENSKHLPTFITELAEDLSKAQAELAALRTPIQSEAGISLGQVAFEAFCPGNTWSYLNHLKVPWEAAAQAVAAVVLAQAVRRMEAVPVNELGVLWDTKQLWHERMELIRARLIAAAKGDGQAEPFVVNEPPQDEKQPDLSGENEKQPEEPAWIPHDGAPCPLKDEEVEVWQAEWTDDSIYRYEHLNPSTVKGWEDDIIAYRVLKWKPGFGPEAKAEPATFEAHGKTWTRHTPGDPMPCDGEALVQCVFADGDLWNDSIPANVVRWTKEGYMGDIIGWRYADEPPQAEAISTEPEDKRLPPLNEADPVGHCAVEAACVHRKLDELGIPREEGGDELSLWGRVEEYAKAQPTQLQQAWTPAVGDTVRLKSGGPVMTVQSVGHEVCCVWSCSGEIQWTKEGGAGNSISAVLATTNLPAACLTPARP